MSDSPSLMRETARTALRDARARLEVLEPQIVALPQGSVYMAVFPGEITRELHAIHANLCHVRKHRTLRNRLGRELGQRLDEACERLLQIRAVIEKNPVVVELAGYSRELRPVVLVPELLQQVRTCLDLVRGDRPPGFP